MLALVFSLPLWLLLGSEGQDCPLNDPGGSAWVARQQPSGTSGSLSLSRRSCAGFQLPRGHWVLVADIPRQLRRTFGSWVWIIYKAGSHTCSMKEQGTLLHCALASGMLLGGKDEKVGPGISSCWLWLPHKACFVPILHVMVYLHLPFQTLPGTVSLLTFILWKAWLPGRVLCLLLNLGMLTPPWFHLLLEF